VSADVLAAGAVLWREGAAGLEVALVHRPRYDDWSLPKGKLDDDETWPAAALREVAEETGFRAVLGRALATVSYDVPEGRKSVRYWAAQASGGSFTPGSEADELRWLAPAEARRLLTYERDRAVLAEFLACPAALRTLLLVRHGKAGNREEWPGDDRLRPLSAAGRRQARALADLLPLFGVSRVHGAPRVRCTQTVEPLADRLGIRITPEPLLSEEGYRADPAAGLRRLLEIVATPGTDVVCSQGGAIPDLLVELSKLAGGWVRRERGNPVAPDPAGGEVFAKKGSVWVLSFDHAALVAGDYHPPRPRGATR